MRFLRWWIAGFTNAAICGNLAPVKVSSKISTAFVLAAVFLLAVEIAAVIIVDHLNSILAEANHDQLQAGQVAEAIQA